MRPPLAALILLLVCRSAFACDVFLLNTRTAMERADVVFEGKVEAISVTESTRPGLEWWHLPWPPHTTDNVVFRVSELTKGRVENTVHVWTGDIRNNCDFTFIEGRTYEVYAHRDGSGQLVTDTLSGTHEVK
jgi:hypothetical protein